MLNKTLLRICIFFFLFGGLFVFSTMLPHTLNVNAQSVDTGGENQQDPSLKEIQEELSTRKDRISQLKKDISRYQDSIQLKRRESITLVNQIGILNEEIRKLELSLELTNTEKAATKLEIRGTEKEIETTQESIQKKKLEIGRLLRLLYQFDRRDMTTILLKYRSVSEFFIMTNSAKQVESRVADTLTDLKKNQRDLERKQSSLEAKKLMLERYAKEIQDQGNIMESTRTARSQILIETKNSEERFRDSLENLKAEQNSINSDIASLEKKVREKIASGGLKKLKELGSSTFIWPVPQNTITAYFHDPDYPFRRVFEHPAVDIRAGQGTPIRAAAPGFVARAKNGGLGYSYIMLVHNDSISTVYGHVSKVLIKEDDFVNQGDIIGYSGGLPGTPGAGPFTTGPHLHFEVRVSGLPTDPFEYLP